VTLFRARLALCVAAIVLRCFREGVARKL